MNEQMIVPNNNSVQKLEKLIEISEIKYDAIKLKLNIDSSKDIMKDSITLNKYETQKLIDELTQAIKNSHNPRLMSISELSEKRNFYIPSYQRGYRWTERQVIDLLEDINEFAKNDKKYGEFYCLQPIVIKRDDKNDRFIVIDGQQRLTTIKIILTYLKVENIFNIHYETREKHVVDSNEENSFRFISNIAQKTETDANKNIDFYHMYKAYQAVNSWFNGKDEIKQTLEKLLLLQDKEEYINGKRINRANNIRVIWYEIGNENEIDIFTRLNIGKIPLTNAELIKALLIQGYGKSDNKQIAEIKQFELASEWDQIEYALQNDDFWYFINKDENKTATRIEFIFELIVKKDKYRESCSRLERLDKKIDKYYEFYIVDEYLKNGERQKDKTKYEIIWNDVKNTFRILNEWYEDSEFFHKVGFLIIYGKKYNLNKNLTILDLIELYNKSNTKKEFIENMNKNIKKVFTVSNENNEFLDIEALNYGSDDDFIRKVLLWFNIATILQDDKSNIRFQFDRFKKENWDIEHIRSQTDKIPYKNEEKILWFEGLKNLNTNIEKTMDQIIDMEQTEFKKYFENKQNEIEKIEENFDVNGIGNLTLLDSETNRSYKNAFFPVKRSRIIKNDQNGVFIPLCTKNVFLKYYSHKIDNPLIWARKDAENYKEAIIEVFNYLEKL